MDYLVDDFIAPNVMFLNIKITENGIIPDLGFLSAGWHSKELILFDKNNVRMCKIELPDFIFKAPLKQDWCFYNNQNEFIITEVYEN